MPIQIHWPDGTVTTPTKGTNMNEANTLTNAQNIMHAQAASVQARPESEQGPMQYPAPPRSIATVAAELQSAMDAAARVPKLRAELDGLLGRKRRGAKKETP